MKTKRQQPDLSTLWGDFPPLCDVMNEGSDLACVLIASSFIDESLRSLLKAHLLKSDVTDRLLDPLQNGAISTFAGKVDLTYALELISQKEHETLKQIGRIRNDFAHCHLELSFADAMVSKAVDRLQYLPSVVDKSEQEGGMTIHPAFLQMAETPRGRFIMTVMFLTNALLCKARRTAEQTPAGDRLKAPPEE